MHGFRCLTHEIEDAIRLLTERHRVRLERVNDVGKFDGVADEKDGEVVTDEVPVAVFGVELDGKPARIAGDFRRIATADDGRKPNRERCLLALFLE